MPQQQHPHANKERSERNKERMGGGCRELASDPESDLVMVLYCTFSFHYTVPLQSQSPVAKEPKKV